MSGLAETARRLAAMCFLPLATRASKAYVAGTKLDDALAICPGLALEGIGSTIGYWDGSDDTPRHVADIYLEIIESVAARQLDSYMSIKFPAIGNSFELLTEVIDRAVERGVRVHFDSLAPAEADCTWAAIRRFAFGPCEVSCTLPSRWQRSLSDVEQVIELGLTVRVVKGQWPDPQSPNMDTRCSYLEVIDRLAGRARHVAVASHDVPLAEEALRRLTAKGTPCGLELLYGLPSHASLQLAHRLGVDVRVYLPYGQAFLPYCMSKAICNPRIFWWLFRDMILRKRDERASHATDTRDLSNSGVR